MAPPSSSRPPRRPQIRRTNQHAHTISGRVRQGARLEVGFHGGALLEPQPRGALALSLAHRKLERLAGGGELPRDRRAGGYKRRLRERPRLERGGRRGKIRGPHQLQLHAGGRFYEGR